MKIVKNKIYRVKINDSVAGTGDDKTVEIIGKYIRKKRFIVLNQFVFLKLTQNTKKLMKMMNVL